MKQIRLETGLTRADFATRYGFNHNRLENIEQGDRETLQLGEIGTYLEIVHHLGRDPREFFPCPDLPKIRPLTGRNRKSKDVT